MGSQEIGGPAPGPHEIVLPRPNGAEDPIKNYWAGYELMFILGESNKLYHVGGTNGLGSGRCGASGVSDTVNGPHDSCVATPNPVQLTDLEGKVPVQVSSAEG